MLKIAMECGRCGVRESKGVRAKVQE